MIGGRGRLPVMAAALVIGLGVLGVAIGVLLFGQRGAPPTSTATPTLLAGASQTATQSASIGGSPSPGSSASPSPSPVATSPGASPSITAEPTQLPNAPMREVVFAALGIDNPIAPEASGRRITFNVDGRGDISAEVADISAGLVTLCLWPGDGSTAPAAADCVVTPDSRIERAAEVGGPWTVLLEGAQPGRSPSVTVLLSFPANDAQLQLSSFRFQGQDSPNYTGFDLRLTALADGQMGVSAAWDDGRGGNYSYDLELLDLSVDFEEPVVDQGIGNVAAATRAATNEHTYNVTMTNLKESVFEAVFLTSTISWP